jgi:hypothetical protein
MNRAALILAIVCLTAPGAARTDDECFSSFPQAVPLCTLLAEAREHDDSSVLVEGIYLRQEHGSLLTATGCSVSRPLVNIRSAPGFKQNDKVIDTLNSLTRKRKAVNVKILGMFHVAPKGRTFGPGGDPYEIEMIAVLCAKAAPKNPNADLMTGRVVGR